jgi:cytochrome c oxidase accessory protein FixG
LSQEPKTVRVSTPSPILPPPAPTGPDRAAAPEVAHDDFRDHLATSDAEGRRRWVYPKKVSGKYFRARTLVSIVLLIVMFGGPFVRIHGNPLLLLNIVERKFVILGQIFWPQDMIIFAIALLIFITGIIIFTAAFGRLWCGWTCPQTVLMEMVFRRIEYLIEGDAHHQRALNAAPWSPRKIRIKALKHAVFFALSFIIGNTLLSYIIGTEPLFKIVTDDPRNHLQGLAFMGLFTFIFYAIFARFREQACTYICPYGRFQSTVLDENSIVVAYDQKRGEKRGHLRHEAAPDQRAQNGFGDCVDCVQCVAVCPTGIDIRNGTQMECVHCTACIDACDAVMTRINRPRGLIRYASLNGIERGEKLRFTPRLAGYAFVLTVLISVFVLMLFTRSDLEADLLRAPGALYQQMPDGRFSNLYTVKVVNKTSREMPVVLRLENAGGSLQIMGGDMIVAPQKLAESSVLIELDPASLKPGVTPLSIGVYSGGKRLQTVHTSFIGPRLAANTVSQP